ncbi:MAG: hypothetical protein K2N55_13305 [Lachnospiraceae bacterium]|nr:hypothetical protein [Lachnospiraceae bacterium]
MIIDEKLLKELQTDDGHMGTIPFSPEVTTLARREGTIEILKKMKAVNIVHIGCCGHFHNIKKQIENHSHFHAMLIQNFERVVGFDIDKKSVDYLSTLGIDDVYAQNFVEDTADVSKIISEKFGGEPYVILLPEVLEHIPNPVYFLEKIVEYHGKNQNKILISVPNAYGFGRVRDALLHNRESINMDHKYMFTPTTILKVICMAGIVPEEILFFDLYKYSRIFKKGMLGNTIVVTGHFEKEKK